MLIHIVLSLTLILNLPIASQKPAGAASSKPDFSGYWNALILKSDDEPIITLKISYSEPKLEITRMVTFREPTIVMGQSLGTKTSNRFVYYTDGRGETQKSITETQDESEIFVHYTDGRGETNMEAGRPVKSVTKWKDQTLIFALSSKSKIAGDTIEIRQTIKWQFTKDDRLVEVSQSSGSAGGGILIPPGPSTLVFARSTKPLR